MTPPDWDDPRIPIATLQRFFPCYPIEVLSHPNAQRSLLGPNVIETFPHIILRSFLFSMLSLEDPGEAERLEKTLWLHILQRCCERVLSPAQEVQIQLILLARLEPLVLIETPLATDYLMRCRQQRIAWGNFYRSGHNSYLRSRRLDSALHQLRCGPMYEYLRRTLTKPALIVQGAIDTDSSSFMILDTIRKSDTTSHLVHDMLQPVIDFLCHAVPDLSCIDPTAEELRKFRPPT